MISPSRQRVTISNNLTFITYIIMSPFYTFLSSLYNCLLTYGVFTMTAVGAYNVGSINICFDEKLKTNQRKAKKDNFQDRKFDESMALGRGDHVGWFAMGSAIVLIFDGPNDFKFTVKHGQKIKFGQALGIVQQV